MKNLITLVSAILFSTLFYKQNIGLNLSIFTLLAILILVIKNNQIFKNTNTLFTAIAYLITGTAVFIYKSNLAIIVNIISFITFIGSVSEHKSSIYVKWVNGIYTVVVSYFSIRFDMENKSIKKKEKIDYIYWLKIIGIPAIILIIFINLYRNGNPMFNELISKIDFTFINFQWILFTTLGYYLFNNISHPIQIEPATSNDLNIDNELEKNLLEPISTQELANENQLGFILMASLNALIIFFIITDVIHVSELYNMNAIQLSKQVHTGVNALVFSNVLAIVIILYFFRGNLNFFDKNKGLKNLTFIWIFLNISVVVITFIKNLEYINSFGFTYKRIGVLFFLSITSIGLITTLIKVSKIKNLWFLLRKNTQIAFALLILSSTLNWDKIITFYNINNAEQLDLTYLIELSNNNTFLLKDYVENNNTNISYEMIINKKHSEYIEKLKDNSWQETVYDNIKIK